MRPLRNPRVLRPSPPRTARTRAPPASPPGTHPRAARLPLHRARPGRPSTLHLVEASPKSPFRRCTAFTLTRFNRGRPAQLHRCLASFLGPAGGASVTSPPSPSRQAAPTRSRPLAPPLAHSATTQHSPQSLCTGPSSPVHCTTHSASTSNTPQPAGPSTIDHLTHATQPLRSSPTRLHLPSFTQAPPSKSPPLLRRSPPRPEHDFHPRQQPSSRNHDRGPRRLTSPYFHSSRLPLQSAYRTTAPPNFPLQAAVPSVHAGDNSTFHICDPPSNVPATSPRQSRLRRRACPRGPTPTSPPPTTTPTATFPPPLRPVPFIHAGDNSI